MQQPDTTELRHCTCPKCKRFYDISITGLEVCRYPLVLPCNHTICEECVKACINPAKPLNCTECGEKVENIPANPYKVYEHFPINYYILGKLYFLKSARNDRVDPFGFQPADANYQGNNNSKKSPPTAWKGGESRKQRNDSSSSQSNATFNSLAVRCSRADCNAQAVLRCKQCAEIYCNECFATVHKAARGLQTHQVLPLNFDLDGVEEKCAKHKEAMIEFFCTECQRQCCCYCLLQDHTGHPYTRIDQEVQKKGPMFEEMIEKGEEVLKHLKTSEQRIAKQITRNSYQLNLRELNRSLSFYFFQLHAKLQFLENKLRQELNDTSGLNIITLNGLKGTVASNIQIIGELIRAAKQGEKVNITALKNIANLPCCFVGEKLTLDKIELQKNVDLDELENQVQIVINDYDQYKLVTIYNAAEAHSECSTEADTSISMQSENSRTSSIDDPVSKWVDQAANIMHKSLNLKPMKPERKESVYVSNIIRPDLFYVQLKSCAANYKQVSNELREYAKSARRVDQPIKDKLYLVAWQNQATNTITWKRARVIDANPETRQCNVFFIDHGRINTIPIFRLREISDVFAEIPPFTTKCRLANIKPVGDNWDVASGQLINNIIAGERVIMDVKNKLTDILEVDIQKVMFGETVSMRDALIFRGYGVPVEAAADDDDVVEVPMPVQKHSMAGKNIKDNDEYQVKVVHVVSPHQVYVQLQHFIQYLNKLNANMTSYYGPRRHQDMIYVPRIGMVVAVNVKSQWRRAQITKVIIPNKIAVRLVDYGTTMEVKANSIRRLIESFRATDFQACEIRLANVKPIGEDDWLPPAVQLLRRYMDAKEPLKMTVIDARAMHVLLFEDRDKFFHCINAELISEALAEPIDKQKNVLLNWPKAIEKKLLQEQDHYILQMIKTIQNSKDKAEDAEEIQNESLRKPVWILRMDGPQLFYVGLKEVAKREEQHRLKCALQSHYATKEAAAHAWSLGDVCVVLAPDKQEQPLYHRAVIIEEANNDEGDEDNKGKYKVILRDSAEEILTDAAHMYDLDDEFRVYHEGAIRCHLAGIIPAGDRNEWSYLAKDYLQTICKTENTFFITKSGQVDVEMKSLPVIIWYAEFIPGKALESSKTILHSVNQLLIQNGLALKKPIEILKRKCSAVEEEEKAARGDSDDPEPTCPPSETKRKRSLPLSNSSSPTPSVEPMSVNGDSPPRVIIEHIDWNDLLDSGDDAQAQQLQQQPQQTDWPPATPFEKAAFRAMVTNVDRHGVIAVHEAEYGVVVNLMEDEMFDYFNKLPPEPASTVWRVGQICTVRYANGKWYRGKITQIKGAEIRVLMVDYGNIETCTHDDLRSDTLYTDFAAFAKYVTLDRVYAKGDTWSMEDVDRIYTKLVDTVVRVTLKGEQVPGKPTPAVIYLDQVNVNRFCLMNCASVCSVEFAMSDSSDNDIVIKEEVALASEVGEQQVIEEAEMAEEEDAVAGGGAQPVRADTSEPVVRGLRDLIGRRVPTTLINVINCTQVVLEIAHAQTSNLVKFFDGLQELAPAQPPLYDLAVNDSCVAMSSNGNRWYRAEVNSTSELRLGRVGVWFIDSGTSEMVARENVRAMKPEWASVPMRYQRASLGHVRVIKKGVRNVLAFMMAHKGSQCLVEIVSVTPLVVELFENDGTLLYQSLIDQHLLVYAKN